MDLGITGGNYPGHGIRWRCEDVTVGPHVITGQKPLRTRPSIPRSGAPMRTFRARLSSKAADDEVVVERPDTKRIVIEYILNMAVSSLARADVEPMYEQYMEDPRLSEEDKEELARAYLLLQMSPIPTSDA